MQSYKNPIVAKGVSKSLKRIVTLGSFAVSLVQPLPLSQADDVDCADTEPALDYWRAIKEQSLTPNAETDVLALELVSCLGSPNSELRDQIAYGLFSRWLRNDRLGDATRNNLLTELSLLMRVSSGPTRVDSSLARSFSALVLAEIMRSDAQKPSMSADQRDELLKNANNALDREQDFRGLDADLGCVHPVAHMSDLLWRFAMHPKTTAEQAQTILAGVRSKVSPVSAAYHFNESDRLARVTSTLIRRQLLDAHIIKSWIETFAKPRSTDKWSDAFKSPSGMAELHNTKQFLRALSDQLEIIDVDPIISGRLNEMRRGFTQLI